VKTFSIEIVSLISSVWIMIFEFLNLKFFLFFLKVLKVLEYEIRLTSISDEDFKNNATQKSGNIYLQEFLAMLPENKQA
jgi:hypothetical protein